MKTHADKTQENKSQAAANRFSEKPRDSETFFQFIDNRPEAAAQRKLQKMASNSLRAKKIDQLQGPIKSNLNPQLILKKENKNRATALKNGTGKEYQKPGEHPVWPIQRKVGLEIEVPAFTLASGTMKKQKKLKKEGKKHPEKQHLLFDSPISYGEVSLPYEPIKKNLTKGKSIKSGKGWDLTADIIGGTPVVEFITKPVDETKEPEKLPAIVGNIADHTSKELADLDIGAYKQLAKSVVITKKDNKINGNIHITGGIRPDRIIDLLTQIASWDGKKSDLKVDKSSRRIIKQAVETGKSSSNDPNYQGLVALLGSYISGQRRFDEMAENGHDMIKMLKDNAPNDSEYNKYNRILYCANSDDLKEFMETGDITKSDKEISKKYGNKEKFFKELRPVLTEVAAPRAAKMMVPVLSRTGLGALRKKVQIDDEKKFKTDVMNAAGLGDDALQYPLFPVGLDTTGHANRTIEAKPDIKIGTWLQSILNGQNLSFTDKTKSFESVGPSEIVCCCFKSREKGAILEIRALDEKDLVPIAKWKPLAKTVVDAYLTLNQIDSG